MLKLERRAGERVILGDDVIVEVLEVRGQIVKLGFDAPRSVRIYREEIWLAVKRENEAAAGRLDFELPQMPGSLPPASPPSASGPGSVLSSGSNDTSELGADKPGSSLGADKPGSSLGSDKPDSA